jgi:hypothetical protein
MSISVFQWVSSSDIPSASLLRDGFAASDAEVDGRGCVVNGPGGCDGSEVDGLDGNSWLRAFNRESMRASSCLRSLDRLLRVGFDHV